MNYFTPKLEKNHFNTALWTIQHFEFEGFLPVFVVNLLEILY